MPWMMQLPQGRAQLQDGTYLIGRSSGAQIQLSDVTVSGQHAQLQVQGDQATLWDVGSSNGTRVNGQRLSPNNPVALPERATVHFGSAGITIVRMSSAPEPAPSPQHQRRRHGNATRQQDAAGAQDPAGMSQSREQRSSNPMKFARVVRQALASALGSIDLPDPPDSGGELVTSHTFVRGIWILTVVMAVALFLPWVDYIMGSLDYLQMWRGASNLRSLADAAGQRLGIWSLALPGLTILAAIEASIRSYLSPNDCSGRALTTGLLGIGGAIAVWMAFSSSTGLDLTGALGTGFYVYSLASVAMACIGAGGLWVGRYG